MQMPGSSVDYVHLAPIRGHAREAFTLTGTLPEGLPTGRCRSSISSIFQDRTVSRPPSSSWAKVRMHWKQRRAGFQDSLAKVQQIVVDNRNDIAGHADASGPCCCDRFCRGVREQDGQASRYEVDEEGLRQASGNAPAITSETPHPMVQGMPCGKLEGCDCQDGIHCRTTDIGSTFAALPPHQGHQQVLLHG